MLEAYADASSSSLDKSRVIDAKKVATARSKLQHMFNPARDLKGLPYCDSASLSTSPNTVTHPLSVSHSYGSAHSLHEGASEGIVHGLPYASSSAAFDQLYKNGRSDDMDESNMDNQGQLDRDLPTDLKQSKRKFDSESGLGDVATSFKRVHADTSPPPPPPSESPSITTGVSSALPVLKSYPVGYHSVSVSVSISSRNSSAALVDEDDVPPPPPPDDFTASASTPLIST